MKRALIAGAFALWSVAVQAGGQTDDQGRMVHGWYLKQNTKDCSILTDFTDDSTLYLSYAYGTDDVQVIFNNPKFKSLKADENYTLKTIFKNGNQIDDSWGDVSFSVLFDGDKRLGLVSQRLDGRDFIKDFASSSLIAFFLGDQLVDKFLLEGSADAVEALKLCALRVEKENPADPFEHGGH